MNLVTGPETHREGVPRAEEENMTGKPHETAGTDNTKPEHYDPPHMTAGGKRQESTRGRNTHGTFGVNRRRNAQVRPGGQEPHQRDKALVAYRTL